MIKNSCLFLIICILTGCSTVSKHQTSQANNKANLLFEQARRNELHRHYEDALSLYETAAEQAILADNFDMQLLNMQGISRVSYLLGDSVRYQRETDRIDTLVNQINPKFTYRLVQLRLWTAINEKNYNYVIELTKNNQGLPIEVRIEYLTYRVQAKAYMNHKSTDDQKQLIDEIQKYQNRRKYKIQAELISNSYYSLAYANICYGSYNNASKWLNKAISIDKDNDLYINLAHDYYLAGRNEIKKRDFPKATSYLLKAHQIYEVMNQTSEANKILEIMEELHRK